MFLSGNSLIWLVDVLKKMFGVLFYFILIVCFVGIDVGFVLVVVFVYVVIFVILLYLILVLRMCVE